MRFKRTGIIRHIDDLGRIVIPVEMRKNFGFEPGEMVEIFVSEDGDLIFRKIQTACIFCGYNGWDVTEALGKPICSDCLMKLKSVNLG